MCVICLFCLLTTSKFRNKFIPPPKHKPLTDACCNAFHPQLKVAEMDPYQVTHRNNRICVFMCVWTLDVNERTAKKNEDETNFNGAGTRRKAADYKRNEDLTERVLTGMSPVTKGASIKLLQQLERMPVNRSAKLLYQHQPEGRRCHGCATRRRNNGCQ
jgi:hypothetical protein